jgi:hypothetical protein
MKRITFQAIHPELCGSIPSQLKGHVVELEIHSNAQFMVWTIFDLHFHETTKPEEPAECNRYQKKGSRANNMKKVRVLSAYVLHSGSKS